VANYEILKENAKNRRKNPTEAEGFLWQNLQNKQLEGYKCRREHVIGDYIVDFVCLSKQLIIEVDGGYHNEENQKELDWTRTAYLNQKGFKVIRFTNEDVLLNIEKTLETTKIALRQSPPEGDLGGSGLLERSYTLKYLFGKEQIEVPPVRRKWSNYIEVLGARQNNLKGINVKFPLNVITAVTGVSGSGKSSLVRDVFYSALKKQLGGIAEKTGLHEALQGSFHLVKDIEFVDQNPIGKSSRSNPVTYIKAYDEIRKLFADQPLSKQMGYTAAYFSFNVDGGRCEECQGEGTTTVEMQFMADLVLTCEECHGKRFKQDILDVTYRGASIFDVLEMTVNQAIEFFSEGTGSTDKRIVKKLKPLQDVGLGYIKLGQSSSTLSGGESQRVKLAAILSTEKPDPSIFIFDEPTTGLHFHDIKTLMKAFNALIVSGHTVVIIEHNPEVIKCADHGIDVGPEGGEKGGNLVFAGTPEELVKCKGSYTGRFLKEKLL
jgi:excinuclease ABC subunit A